MNFMLSGINSRIDGLQTSINGHFGTMDSRFQSIEGRLTVLDERLDGIAETQSEHTERFNSIDKGFSSVRSELASALDGLRFSIERIDPTAVEPLQEWGQLFLANLVDNGRPDDAVGIAVAHPKLFGSIEQLSQQFEISSIALTEKLHFAQQLMEEERYLTAEDTLLSALRLAPANTDILFTLGKLYLRMGDFGRVQSVANALRRIGGEAAVQAANGIDAEQLNQQRGVDEALAFLEGLASVEDASLAARVALVETQIRVGSTARALALARNLQAENPDNETLNILLAVTHSLNGDLEQAMALYLRLLKSEPAQPSLWLELSRLQQRQGAREAAKASIEEGLSHTPDAENLLWARASLLEQEGDIDAAIATYEQLHAQNSNSLLVANNLASLLATYRNDDASLEQAWSIARRLKGAELPALQDTYGWILHRRGESEEAISYLEDAAEALPNNALVQYHLGQAYRAAGRSQDALVQLRKAINIAGLADKRPQIETARRLVQELQHADTKEN